MRRIKCFLSLVTGLSLAAPLLAQTNYPKGVERSDVLHLSQQELDIVAQVNPVAKTVASHVVSIQVPTIDGWKLVALGTVTEKGIVTKWSEVKPFIGSAVLAYPKQPSAYLKLKGVYEEYDLALLENSQNLPAIKMGDFAKADLGDFVILAGPEQARGFGVISVKERSLKEQDKGFLGIRMNFEDRSSNGVLLTEVVPETGAFRGGLKKGDRLLSIDQAATNSMIEARSVIQNLKPGQEIKVKVQRAGEELTKSIVLGARKKERRFPEVRLNQMERMGGDVSRVRNEFPSSIQTDMQLGKENMGAPLLDLEGKFVGVALSRSRIKTHVIPADDLAALLEEEPQRLAQPIVKYNEPRQGIHDRRMNPLQGQNLPHNEGIRAKMKQLQEELQTLEQLLRSTR